MKCLFVLAAAIGLFFNAPVHASGANDYGMQPGQGGPLCCGDFSAAMRGGVVPALATDRGEMWITVPSFPPISIDEVPSYSDAYRVPWAVGAEVAWSASKRVQLFLEYSYNRASGKPFDLTVLSMSLSAELSDYQAHNGYLGVRYYLDRPCWILSRLFCWAPGLRYLFSPTPYVGFKGGFSWRKAIGSTLTSQPFYESDTALSGGLLTGVEWWLSKCLSVMVQVEWIATQGFCGDRVMTEFARPLAFTSLWGGGTEWLMTFPITLGLRWTF